MSTNFFMLFDNFNLLTFFKSIFHRGEDKSSNDKVKKQVLEYISKLSNLAPILTLVFCYKFI